MAKRRRRPDSLDDVGKTIDERFQFQALVGSGSTGDVYRVKRVSDGETLAVKVLDPALSKETRLVERFRREVAVCSRLKHPNTVRVFDYGRFIDGRLYLAMEYLEGLTLGRTLRRERPLSVLRACSIARQVAEALTESHGLNIIHRDLKPENIFLARVGAAVDFVKILDFGIARFVGEGTIVQTLTREGFVAGTPLYLSPEQGLGKELDGRSDLYTLGIILYEMLVGVPPFRAETPVALVLKHIHETPPRPRTVNPAVRLPEPLLDLLGKLLAKDPNDRPQSASVVASLLERIESEAAHQAEFIAAPMPRDDEEYATQKRMSQLFAMPAGTDGVRTAKDLRREEEAVHELSSLLHSAMEEVEVDYDTGESAVESAAGPNEARPTVPNMTVARAVFSDDDPSGDALSADALPPKVRATVPGRIRTEEDRERRGRFHQPTVPARPSAMRDSDEVEIQKPKSTAPIVVETPRVEAVPSKKPKRRAAAAERCATVIEEAGRDVAKAAAARKAPTKPERRLRTAETPAQSPAKPLAPAEPDMPPEVGFTAEWMASDPMTAIKEEAPFDSPRRPGLIVALFVLLLLAGALGWLLWDFLGI